MTQLREGAARQDPPGALAPYGFGGNVYWLGWPQKFDYVLVMSYGGDEGAVPSGLVEVARVGDGVLYEVKARGSAPGPR